MELKNRNAFTATDKTPGEWTGNPKEIKPGELSFLTTILLENKNKNFVDRIINRANYPIMKFPDGNYSTQKMAFSETDNGAIVYPTIIYNPLNKTLQRFPPKEALSYAIQNGEYIKFPNSDLADYFTKNYRKVWGKE